MVEDPLFFQPFFQFLVMDAADEMREMQFWENISISEDLSHRMSSVQI